MNALNISQTSFVEDVTLKETKKGNDDYELTVHYTEGEPIAEKYQALRQKSISKRFLKDQYPLSLQNLKICMLYYR